MASVGSRRVIDPDFWSQRRVFLTGHTGFKGSWLSLWLQSMGATVKGFALAPPTAPALFEVARVGRDMESEIGDIRDAATLTDSLIAFQPDIVIHMAAQPLVRLSYEDPVGTYATNVMGTVHLLEAVRRAPSVKAALSVTTDKCYENREWPWGYRENEAMGGRDPYSNSKGCAELVGRAYRDSFLTDAGVSFASGRAGNVVGGGDWAADRLIPDILRAFEQGAAARIRNPLSTRPWQHVLEPLSGYLVLCEALWQRGTEVAEGWNFGPKDDDAKPVQWIVERMVTAWGNGARWERDADYHPHEARYLKLDVSKAAEVLHWHPVWRLDGTLRRIVDWHRAWLTGADMRLHCLQEIQDYTASCHSRYIADLPTNKIVL